MATYAELGFKFVGEGPEYFAVSTVSGTDNTESFFIASTDADGKPDLSLQPRAVYNEGEKNLVVWVGAQLQLKHTLSLKDWIAIRTIGLIPVDKEARTIVVRMTPHGISLHLKSNPMYGVVLPPNSKAGKILTLNAYMEILLKKDFERTMERNENAVKKMAGKGQTASDAMVHFMRGVQGRRLDALVAELASSALTLPSPHFLHFVRAAKPPVENTGEATGVKFTFTSKTFRDGLFINGKNEVLHSGERVTVEHEAAIDYGLGVGYKAFEALGEDQDIYRQITLEELAVLQQSGKDIYLVKSKCGHSNYLTINCVLSSCVYYQEISRLIAYK